MAAAPPTEEEDGSAPPSGAPSSPSAADSALASLREQLAAAIDSLDLPLARALQQRLDRTLSEDHEVQVAELRQELDRDLDVLATDYRRRRGRLVRAFHARELAARRALDGALDAARARQLGRLGALQASLLGEFRAEMAKPLPRHSALLEQARANAARQDFDRAQRDQDEAAALLAAEGGRRREAYERAYRGQIAACVRQQDQELEALQMRLRDAVGDLEKERERDLARELAKFRRDLARAYRQRADQIASPAKRALPRRLAADCLNALEDAYGCALVRFGLAAAEDSRRPPLLAPGVRIESALSLRMQSRIESRIAQSERAAEASGRGGKRGAEARPPRGDSRSRD
jgi:hypothetical protein